MTHPEPPYDLPPEHPEGLGCMWPVWIFALVIGLALSTIGSGNQGKTAGPILIVASIVVVGLAGVTHLWVLSQRRYDQERISRFIRHWNARSYRYVTYLSGLPELGAIANHTVCLIDSPEGLRLLTDHQACLIPWEAIKDEDVERRGVWMEEWDYVEERPVPVRVVTDDTLHVSFSSASRLSVLSLRTPDAHQWRDVILRNS